MTINELMGHGIILHGIGRIVHMDDPDESCPHGHERVLFETAGAPMDLYGPIDRTWADRDIKYMYPTAAHGGLYPTITIEVG